MKKDKDGNWEFEYDTPGEDDSSGHSDDPENATIQQGGSSERPAMSRGDEQDDAQTLNLVG